MSAVSRALSGGERKLYLMGWIAAVEWHDGSEWGLNQHGHLESRHGTVDKQTRVHGTISSARTMAVMHKESYPDSKAYFRSYAYETPDVETAKKFCVQPLRDFVPMKEFV